MPSSHSSLVSQPRSVVDEAFDRLQEKLLTDSARIRDQLAEVIQKRNAIRNPPDYEAAARISNPGAALSTLPLSILGVPGTEYSLRRSARLAAKASEPQVYATDPDFWAIDERTDKRDLNPSHAAEALLLLSSQPRSDPFNEAEMAGSVREGWGVT